MEDKNWMLTESKTTCAKCLNVAIYDVDKKQNLHQQQAKEKIKYGIIVLNQLRAKTFNLTKEEQANYFNELETQMRGRVKEIEMAISMNEVDKNRKNG